MDALTLEVAGDSLRPVVERLWQLYAHDLSEFRDTLPDDSGAFKPGRLPLYFEDPDRQVHLVRQGKVPVGFAMVRGFATGPRVMGEFFVVRAVRRTGVGFAAATMLLDRHPGAWEIAFQEENPGAAAFWRRVGRHVAGGGRRVREERRPVPNKPHVPPDTWLLVEGA